MDIRYLSILTELFQVKVLLKTANLKDSGKVIMLRELRNQREKEQTFFSTVYGFFMIRPEIQLKK